MYLQPTLNLSLRHECCRRICTGFDQLSALRVNFLLKGQALSHLSCCLLYGRLDKLRLHVEEEVLSYEVTEEEAPRHLSGI